MNDIFGLIRRKCRLAGGTGSSLDMPQAPEGYAQLLEHVDGFVTKSGFFKVFGTKPLGTLPSVYSWNDSEWKANYGASFEGVFIIGEDVFGDQYGFSLAEGRPAELCKVLCEGGKKEHIEEQDFLEFIKRQIGENDDSLYDHQLAITAMNGGLQAKDNEHLAFSLPLICGGEYHLSNLTIESVPLHLGLLAQMTRKNDMLGDGTAIARFTEG